MVTGILFGILILITGMEFCIMCELAAIMNKLEK
jgi:hypothetical protein